MLRRSSQLALVALLTAVLATTGFAASLRYDGGMGNTVRFGMVTESSATGALPLYDVPEIVGDMLVFDPADFESLSEDGDADITDGRLSLMVFAKPGYKITGIWIDEFGDYSLVGGPVLAGVGSTAFVTADGIGPHVGGASFSDDESLDIATPWSLRYGVAVPRADKITIVLDNTLTTLAGEVSAAFIKKKGFKLTVHTVIPEPGSLMLLGLGAVGLAVVGFRRRTR